MPRYIDANALVAELQKKPIHDGHFIHTRDVSDAIFYAPTISPDEVRGVGKWIESIAGLRCSICNEPLGLMVGAKNYCPNCGAKMEVSEDG